MLILRFLVGNEGARRLATDQGLLSWQPWLTARAITSLTVACFHGTGHVHQPAVEAHSAARNIAMGSLSHHLRRVLTLCRVLDTASEPWKPAAGHTLAAPGERRPAALDGTPSATSGARSDHYLLSIHSGLVGRRVLLHGLRTDALDDLFGTVLEFKDAVGLEDMCAKGRVPVAVDGLGRKAVKPNNLALLSAEGEAGCFHKLSNEGLLADALLGLRICKVDDAGGFAYPGTVECVYENSTRKRLYRVKYDDADIADLDATTVRQCSTGVYVP